jgi:deoxyadenosine/deoxycytidine kinase
LVIIVAKKEVFTMENLRIGIVGNIGVGKSTLVNAAIKPPLSDLLLSVFPVRDGTEKVHAFKEAFNPVVLDAFYKDPVAHAFTAQIEFFNGRLERQKKIAHAKGIVLEDRTLAEDYNIFGMAQKILGHMNVAEFEAYKKAYDMMTEKIAEPDLIVYLKADVPTLLSRIRERGRQSELSIPASYLETLNELYEQFISRQARCPVLVIDTSKGNGNIESQLKEIVQKTVDKIKQIDLRVTTPGLSSWVTLPETEATIKAIEAERKLEEYLSKRHKVISLAGNVGLGKSTLAAIMERSLKISGLYENPEENPMLEKFLADKKTYCYELQLSLLEMRSHLRRKAKDGEGSYVKDRAFAEDILVFCQQFNRDGHLTDRELDSLFTEFKSASMHLPSADLIVVLQGTPEIAWKRIQQRGREMEVEGGWSLSEIRALSHWYKSYPKDVKKFGFHDGPVVEIDVDKVDLTNRIHVGYIFEKIYEALVKQEKKEEMKKQEKKEVPNDAARSVVVESEVTDVSEEPL